jgi:signal transduction histidine kinase
MNLSARGRLRGSTFRMITPAVITFLLYATSVYFIFLPMFESFQMERERKMLCELVNTVLTDIKEYNEEVSAGKLTVDEAKTAAAEHIRKLRYGRDFKDYFWIHDLNLRMIMHPYRNDLEGQDISNFTDPSGKRLFVEMVEVARKSGQGYVSYMWQWKDDPSRIVPKISYVRLFKPWGWVVGTGVYLEDLRNEVASTTGWFTLLSWGILAIVTSLSIYLVRIGVKSEDKRLAAENDLKAAAQKLAKQKGELQKLVEELKHSNKELDDFAYVVSHDLKEPLRGVASFAELLMLDYSEKLDDEARSRLETVKRLSLRMQKLIETLLHYSRVGKKKPEMKGNDLGALLEEVLDSLKVSIDESGAQVRIQKVMPIVKCDRVQMSEVFTNLIANAIRYNDKTEKLVEIGWYKRAGGGGETDLAISGYVADGECVFYVRDNGIGIAAKDHEAVFTIFKRLNSRNQYGEGTGAGLTIVRKIIERHGGRIWIESEVGVGSTFHFTLD